MKIAGIELDAPKNVIIPIPRGDQDVIFQAACITDMKELDDVLKEPEVPMILHRGARAPVPNIDDAEYMKKVSEYSEKRINWLVAKSLLATEGLSWEKVDFTNPETWVLYQDELKDSGFNEYQIVALVRGVMEANGISEDRVKEAKERFLALQREPQLEQSSQTEEQPST